MLRSISLSTFSTLLFGYVYNLVWVCFFSIRNFKTRPKEYKSTLSVSWNSSSRPSLSSILLWNWNTKRHISGGMYFVVQPPQLFCPTTVADPKSIKNTFMPQLLSLMQILLAGERNTFNNKTFFHRESQLRCVFVRIRKFISYINNYIICFHYSFSLQSVQMSNTCTIKIWTTTLT